MKVILLQDVENLGKKWEVKNVPLGYAKNYLFPKNLAKIADEKSMEDLEKQKELEIKKAEEELKTVQEIASQLDGRELIIPMKVSEEGTIFGSVDVEKITEELNKLGFEISKKQIILEKPIKEVGEFPVLINFEHGLEVEIKVIVTEEK